MKPKDLKTPYTFSNRRPYIRESICYVPVYYPHYQEFLFPPWEKVFGNNNPIHIEYCSGNGEWILNKANENLSINWVAVELKFARVRKIHAKRMNRNIQNLFIVCGEAQVFTREYLLKNSVERAYINFPDPWPKDRHAKHRLVQAVFMKDLLEIMQPGGKVQLVTDAEFYMEQMKEEVKKVLGWKQSYLEEKDNYGTSYFERLWRSRGREIHYLEYRCEKQ